jgi:hypothetical protein
MMASSNNGIVRRTVVALLVVLVLAGCASQSQTTSHAGPTTPASTTTSTRVTTTATTTPRTPSPRKVASASCTPSAAVPGGCVARVPGQCPPALTSANGGTYCVCTRPSGCGTRQERQSQALAQAAQAAPKCSNGGNPSQACACPSGESPLPAGYSAAGQCAPTGIATGAPPAPTDPASCHSLPAYAAGFFIGGGVYHVITYPNSICLVPLPADGYQATTGVATGYPDPLSKGNVPPTGNYVVGLSGSGWTFEAVH